MIFLTIGSHEPFDRIVMSLDVWASANPSIAVFGQITDRGTYKPHFNHVAYLTPAEYEAKCMEASLLVAHAGMGSIITAMDLGKPIVIMPRRGHLLETRNDHQHATAKKFQGKPQIFVAENETVLGDTITTALASATSSTVRGSHFAQAELLTFIAESLR